MKKILQIGWKDLRVIFRDRAALILMLLAPFALTLGLGLVTGSLGSGSSGLSQVPVIVVNLDQNDPGKCPGRSAQVSRSEQSAGSGRK